MSRYGLWTTVMLIAACGGAECRAAVSTEAASVQSRDLPRPVERVHDVPVLPIESCNGADDDADGTVDENCAAPGTLLWAAHLNGTGNGLGYSVAALPDGGAVVTGLFWGEVAFGPAEGGDFRLRSSGRGDNDVFIAKYRADGVVAWAAQAGSPGDDIGIEVAALADGSVVVVGTSVLGGNPDTNATFGPGERGEVQLAPADALGMMFLAKYDSEGALVWAKRADGPGIESPHALAALADGSVVVTGAFTGTMTFGPHEAREVTVTSVGGEDMFVAKFDRAGALAWVKSASGGSGNGVAALPDGSVLVTGSFGVESTFAAGESGQVRLRAAGLYDVFVAHYAANGSLLWARSAGASDCDYGSAIAASSDRSSFVTAIQESRPASGARSDVTFAGSGEALLLAKYDASGFQLWARSAVGAGYHYGEAVARMPDGGGVVTGMFRGHAVFGAGEAREVTLTAAALGTDMFIARYDTAGELGWAIRVGSKDDDGASGIAVLRDGAVVVTGTVSSATFSASATFATATSAALQPGFFLAKVAP